MSAPLWACEHTIILIIVETIPRRRASTGCRRRKENINLLESIFGPLTSVLDLDASFPVYLLVSLFAIKSHLAHLPACPIAVKFAFLEVFAALAIANVDDVACTVSINGGCGVSVAGCLRRAARRDCFEAKTRKHWGPAPMFTVM